MKFTETVLKGAFTVDPELIEDDRGFFARSWCSEEFKERGLSPNLVQCSISYNAKRGTLRGMHFQAAPFEEAKLVRCTMGSIYDVIVDLRPKSPTFKKWSGFELTAQNRKALYIPKGFAHGFLTLESSTEVLYQMPDPFSAAHARGVRWNDPAFGIRWPFDPTTLSAKDSGYPDFQ
jgi:dTDP-4-dehydrorhamnose 3,5-epimerase